MMKIETSIEELKTDAIFPPLAPSGKIAIWTDFSVDFVKMIEKDLQNMTSLCVNSSDIIKVKIIAKDDIGLLRAGNKNWFEYFERLAKWALNNEKIGENYYFLPLKNDYNNLSNELACGVECAVIIRHDGEKK